MIYLSFDRDYLAHNSYYRLLTKTSLEHIHSIKFNKVIKLIIIKNVISTQADNTNISML
jgi:hypothetical protein